MNDIPTLSYDPLDDDASGQDGLDVSLTARISLIAKNEIEVNLLITNEFDFFFQKSELNLKSFVH